MTVSYLSSELPPALRPGCRRNTSGELSSIHASSSSVLSVRVPKRPWLLCRVPKTSFEDVGSQLDRDAFLPTTRGFWGVSSTKIISVFPVCSLPYPLDWRSEVVLDILGLGLGLNVRDILTSRFKARFFPGPMLTERLRSSLSCASDTESEQDRTRLRERELAVEETKSLVDIGNEGTTRSSGEEDREVVAVSISEKGEFGKTFDLSNEHSSGRSDLNLWDCTWGKGKQKCIHSRSFYYILTKELSPIPFITIELRLLCW